jgi:hypothetical protein
MMERRKGEKERENFKSTKIKRIWENKRKIRESYSRRLKRSL